MKKLIAGALLLAACGASSADKNAARAKNAIDEAAYYTELSACRDQAKAAKSYAVYEACATTADVKYGRVTDGGAP